MKVLRNPIFRKLIATSTVTFCVSCSFQTYFLRVRTDCKFSVSGLHNGKVWMPHFINIFWH
jgi:hypothetical protein